jgi:hypothetical protein
MNVTTPKLKIVGSYRLPPVTESSSSSVRIRKSAAEFFVSANCIFTFILHCFQPVRHERIDVRNVVVAPHRECEFAHGSMCEVVQGDRENKGNIDLVTKYYDKLVEALSESDE